MFHGKTLSKEVKCLILIHAPYNHQSTKKYADGLRIEHPQNGRMVLQRGSPVTGVATRIS
uniref:Uncharacterized protein n=1 Tax=Arundo donax TaxID=35708 RepID=A0A0A9DSL3_ARUDO